MFGNILKKCNVFSAFFEKYGKKLICLIIFFENTVKMHTLFQIFSKNSIKLHKCLRIFQKRINKMQCFFRIFLKIRIIFLRSTVIFEKFGKTLYFYRIFKICGNSISSRFFVISDNFKKNCFIFAMKTRDADGTIVGRQCDIVVVARAREGEVTLKTRISWWGEWHRPVLTRGVWPIMLSFVHPTLSDIYDLYLLLDSRAIMRMSQVMFRHQFRMTCKWWKRLVCLIRHGQRCCILLRWQRCHIIIRQS